ncbi:MAG: hypothetical protein ABSG46_06350 [Candidatus Binataceae bacterium]|jgi:hypothetical protein
MTRKLSLGVFAMGVLLCGLAAPACAGSRPPFAKSCLSGRYTMSATAWDVTNNYPPGTPFALAGYVVTVCTSAGAGTYTGQIFATYPGVTPPPVCNITDGTYSIDATSGAITSSATLADVTTGSCAAFGNKSLAESGYLSDPTGQQLYQVETGQAGGDTINYVWTRQKGR